MIEKVEMLENGKAVAVDQHLAPAGPGYDNNEFQLNISTVDPSAKYSLRAWVHSSGGNDSTSYVTVSPRRKDDLVLTLGSHLKIQENAL